MQTELQTRADAAQARTPEKTRARERAPLVDVFENESEVLIVADVPGVAPDQLDLRVELPELRIEARPADAGAPVWVRAFSVDARIDAEKVSAELKHGVLTIRLPKADEVKPRKIAIRAAS